MAGNVPRSEFAQPAIPAFLSKLRLLVDDEETNDLIYWDPGGTSFHICDGNRLAKEVLPLFFKHNNLSSFIRQLNMYGFRKVNRVDPCMTFKSEIEDMEFKHPYFLQHRPHLITKIQRKPPNQGYSYFDGRTLNLIGGVPSIVPPSQLPRQTTSTSPPRRPFTGTDFLRLTSVIQRLRLNQETMSKQIGLLQSENQLLFREVHDLRERHEHQSQIIQTLFSFLSAFAKDNRAQNFRITPKRMALPFSSSGVFPTQSRTGLKLNLPQGHRLGDATDFQTLKLSPSTDLLEPAYKLFKMENHLPMLPNSLSSQPELSQSLDCQIVDPNSDKLLDTNSVLMENSNDTTSALYSLGDLESITWPGSAADNPTAHVKNPLRLLLSGQPKAFSTNSTDSLCIRPDIKPVVSPIDPTMTSLTRGPSLSNALAVTSPIDLMSTCESTASDNQHIDLNLSRCTTPLSLIQPDSVDLCDFLANREENGSEISIDDLFLASTGLDDPTFKYTGNKTAQLTKSVPSPGGQSSTSSDATVPLKSDSANDSFSSDPAQLDSLNTPTSDPLNETLFGYAQKATDGAPAALSHVENPISDQLPLDLQRRNNDEDAVDDPDDLFGLPWEEHEVATDTPNEKDKQNDQDLNSFNAGLLPTQDRANYRIKILPRPDRSTFNSTNRRSALNNHNFIVGNEIIPAEAAVPFANVPAPFQLLQPAVLIPSPVLPAQSTNPFPSQALPGSPFIVANQLKVPTLRFTRATTVPSSSNILVSNAPLVVFTSDRQPTNLAKPTNAVANAIKARLSAPHLGPMVKRKERPSFRPIAPSIKPSPRLPIQPRK